MSQAFHMRDGCDFRCTPKSAYGFEFFTFRSPPMVKEMDVFLKLTKGCNRLLDIGAFHGVFSLAFVASHGGRIAHAIEPSPVAFGDLKENASLNEGIATSKLAMSDKLGMLDMSFEWDHVVAKNTHGHFPPLNIESFTVDAYCLSEDFIPDVVKIDVEGHEMKVLRGMSGLMSAGMLIFIELHPEHLILEGDKLEDILEFASNLGFAAHNLDHQRLDSLEGVDHIYLMPQ